MLTLRALIGPGFFGLIGRVNAIPGETTPDETIDGFPEFAFTVDTLTDPLVKQKLRAIAKRIVVSHQTRKRIIGFEVHGHADQTLRLPPGAERDRAEFEVSRDRAENATQLLLQMIEEEGGKAIIEGIKANTKATGFGSQFRIFRPAVNDPQRRQNRRVEIFLKEFDPPPPRPSPPDPPPSPEVRTRFRVQIRSGILLFFSTPNPLTALSVRISLNLTIFDVDRKEQANFSATALGKAVPPLGVGGANPLTSVAVARGPAVDFNAADGVRLGNFDGDLQMSQSPQVVGLDLGGSFGLFFEALVAPTRPKPVLVKGGNVPGVPQINFLGIPLAGGTLKMEGQPAPSP